MKKVAVFLLALAVGGALVAQTEPLEIEIASQPLNRALEVFAEQSGLQVVYVSEVAEGVDTSGFSGRGTVEEAMAALLDGTELTWSFANERTITLAQEVGEDSADNERPAESEDDAEDHSEDEEGDDSKQDPKEDEEQGSGTGEAGEEEQESSTDSGGSADDEAPASAVGDVITVTAQLRKQTLREVPVSVTVLSGESMERQGMVSLLEVARQTPGFTSSSFNESEPIIALRGASNTFSQAGASKPVGVFLDGVYISRNSGSAFDLYDLEQVEILRGPQGTLFGRNVTGGAIVLTTSKPEFGRSHSKFDLGFGNYGAAEARGLVGANLSDKAAGKLSATVRSTDGYGSERLLGIDQNDLDTVNLRGQISFLIGDSGLLRLTADVSDDENHGRTLSTVTPAAANDGDIRTSEHGHAQIYERDMSALTAHFNWTTLQGDFESITAYRDADVFEDFAFSSTSFMFLPRFNPFFPFQQIGVNTEQPETLSQEIRFISKQTERFDYVAGLYYFDEQIRRRATSIRLGGSTGDTIRDLTFDQDVSTESYALYADLHVPIGDSLHLNVGGRYTEEEKSVQVGFENTLSPAADFESDRFQESWSEFTPRLALTWSPRQTLSVFASYTQGFTAGGFNTEEDTPEVIGRPFDPETITAVELGVKTASSDNRLAFNATLFRQEYEDKQEGFLDPTFNFVIVNAAEATMDGVEAELYWRIGEASRLSAFYAYLNATYDRFFIERTSEDRSGNFLASSPEASFGLNFDYLGSIGESGEIAFNASYTQQDDYFTGSENRDTFLIDSYGLLNASITYGPRDGIWRLTAWGKNLGDEEYVLIRSDFGVGGIGEHFGPPQTFGLRLTIDI